MENIKEIYLSTPQRADKKVAKLSLSQEFLNYFVKEIMNFNENHKIIKNVKVVNLKFLKVKTWFGDKDL